MELIEVSALGLVTAALAGTVSFLSPCVLPLVPGYLSYISSRTAREATGWKDRVATLWPALWFVFGFTTVFVLLGVSAQSLGGLLQRYNYETNLIGGGLVVFFGLVMTGLFQPLPYMRDVRWRGPDAVAGPGGAYLLGLAFAFGWTPCIGPVLASILAVTAASAANGALLLGAYGLGLGVPFLLTALLLGGAATSLHRMRHVGRILNLVAGGVMIGVGVLMMTGRLQEIAIWLLETFPVLGRLG